MYSGSTFNAHSGQFLGAHQKIDRVARRHLEQLQAESGFPSTRLILKFEGNNGPDGIKRKSPAQDEPWHYIQPFDESDVQLIDLIESNYQRLVKALKARDEVRSAFEAAWLAHAIVDGLTPAHHYPYEEKLIELRGGEGIESRTTIAKKLIMPGDTVSKQMANNWRMWGPKGLFTTHAGFEAGVATLIAPLRLPRAMPTEADITDFQKTTLAKWFRAEAQNVAKLELYDEFYKTGWTIPLGRRVRRQLAPMLVKAVTVTWYCALQEAQKGKMS